ncbi:unnamed protein product [Orchesella dallaii]|uniref:Uncharacterized protein n=1 Tax=Orchesella dallaii TaxID=48710 RepID=A0ABP1RX43_9HEXA
MASLLTNSSRSSTTNLFTIRVIVAILLCLIIFGILMEHSAEAVIVVRARPRGRILRGRALGRRRRYGGLACRKSARRGYTWTNGAGCGGRSGVGFAGFGLLIG